MNIDVSGDIAGIMNEKGLDVTPSNIDKKLFDVAIMPLITGVGGLDVATRLEHLHNIWRNYTTNKSLSVVELKEGYYSHMSNNIFAPMAIIDTDGTVVDITPPLYTPMIIPNTNTVASGIQLEQSNNPLATAGALGRRLGITGGEANNDWLAFLARYNSGAAPISRVDDTDTQGLVEE